jgi:hypothetical protein
MKSRSSGSLIIYIVPPPPPPCCNSVISYTEVSCAFPQEGRVYRFTRESENVKKYEGPDLSAARIDGVLIFYKYLKEGLDGR